MPIKLPHRLALVPHFIILIDHWEHTYIKRAYKITRQKDIETSNNNVISNKVSSIFIIERAYSVFQNLYSIFETLNRMKNIYLKVLDLVEHYKCYIDIFCIGDNLEKKI